MFHADSFADCRHLRGFELSSIYRFLGDHLKAAIHYHFKTGHSGRPETFCPTGAISLC